MTRPFQVTGLLQQQAWASRVLPPVEKVQDGLWSIPVPIPNNPLRYVLVYVLELSDGVALVDAGWDTPEAWDALPGRSQPVLDPMPVHEVLGLPLDEVPPGAIEWPNDFGDVGYGGPCPPGGDTHTYLFTVHALNQQVEVADDAGATEVVDLLNQTSILESSVSGTYARAG